MRLSEQIRSDQKLLQTGADDLRRSGRGIGTDRQGSLIRVVKSAYEKSPGFLYDLCQKTPVRIGDMQDLSPEKFHKGTGRRERHYDEAGSGFASGPDPMEFIGLMEGDLPSRQ